MRMKMTRQHDMLKNLFRNDYFLFIINQAIYSIHEALNNFKYTMISDI